MVERNYPLQEVDDLELGNRAVENMEQQDADERRLRVTLAEAQVAVADSVEIDAA